MSLLSTLLCGGVYRAFCVYGCGISLAVAVDPAIMGVGPAVAIPAAVEMVRGLLRVPLQLRCLLECVCVRACMLFSCGCGPSEPTRPPS
jgi:hypothetical protein